LLFLGTLRCKNNMPFVFRLKKIWSYMVLYVSIIKDGKK